MRILSATLLMLAIASGAHATSLSMSGPTSVSIGETFDITITADSQLATAGDEIFVVVRFDPTLVSANGGSADTYTQNTMNLPADVGANQGMCAWEPGRDDQCLAFEQTFFLPALPADPGDFVATLSFTWIGLGGVAAFTFQDAAPDDFIFFDLGDDTDVGTAPSGWSVTAVPEPGTAALVVLGLAGLTARRRSGLVR